MIAQEIMSTQVPTAAPATPVEEVLRMMVEQRAPFIAVVDGERRVLGVITEHDLMYKAKPLLLPPHSVLARLRRDADAWEKYQRELRKAIGRTAGDVMTSPAITVDHTAPIADIAELMVARNVKHLPVVANGKLVGIVSRADVLRALLSRKT